MCVLILLKSSPESTHGHVLYFVTYTYPKRWGVKDLKMFCVLQWSTSGHGPPLLYSLGPTVSLIGTDCVPLTFTSDHVVMLNSSHKYTCHCMPSLYIPKNKLWIFLCALCVFKV